MIFHLFISTIDRTKATAKNAISVQKKLPVNKKTRIASIVAGKNSINIFKKKAIIKMMTTRTTIPIQAAKLAPRPGNMIYGYIPS